MLCVQYATLNRPATSPTLTSLPYTAAYSRSQADSFRFANYYGDHMVLQRAPARANVWGFVEGCEAVKVDFNGTKIDATIVQAKGEDKEGPQRGININIYKS